MIKSHFRTSGQQMITIIAPNTISRTFEMRKKFATLPIIAYCRISNSEQKLACIEFTSVSF